MPPLQHQSIGHPHPLQRSGPPSPLVEMPDDVEIAVLKDADLFEGAEVHGVAQPYWPGPPIRPPGACTFSISADGRSEEDGGTGGRDGENFWRRKRIFKLLGLAREALYRVYRAGSGEGQGKGRGPDWLIWVRSTGGRGPLSRRSAPGSGSADYDGDAAAGVAGWVPRFSRPTASRLGFGMSNLASPATD